jgi:ankyrin repeat protein
MSTNRMNSLDEELIWAAEENDLPEVRRLLSVGAGVNATDSRGWTPLHRASVHLQVVKELIGHGADIEAKDNDGWTPLHWACYNDRSAVVTELLNHGANTEVKDNAGYMPLHFAAIKGHLATVNELISPNERNGATTILGKRKSRGGADTEAKDSGGDTPLHCASECGHLPIVKALLSGGSDILASNNRGRLPIHLAVSQGKSDVSKYLLQHFYATIMRPLPLHQLLKDLTWTGDPNSSDVPPLRAALDENVMGTDDVVVILEYLIDQNPHSLASSEQDGSSPLHVACRRGASFTIVQSLVNLYKASVKSVTSEGDLPLFLACEKSETSLDTIFLLMKLYPELVYR